MIAMNLYNGSTFTVVVLIPFFVIGLALLAFLYKKERWPFGDDRIFEPWAYDPPEEQDKLLAVAYRDEIAGPGSPEFEAGHPRDELGKWASV